jgi:hypothetical protein
MPIIYPIFTFGPGSTGKVATIFLTFSISEEEILLPK